MLLRKTRTAEEVRRRKGIDSFVRSLGASAAEYGKERLRDYPKEVASGWKNFLGISKKEVPESLEGITPVAESVGGLSVTIPRALKQLGQSVVKLRPKHPSYTRKTAVYFGQDPNKIPMVRFPRERIPTKNVRKMAANIRRSPKEALEPLTSVKYKGDLGRGVLGQNIRQRGGSSKIELTPKAEAETWFHELSHSTAFATKGDKTLQGYLSDLLETSTNIGKGVVDKAKDVGKIKKGRPFYQDQPIESHARLTSWALRDKLKKITSKEYTEDFNRAAKVVMERVKKQSPTLYKRTLKEVAKGYRKRVAISRKLKEGKLPETFDEWLEGVVQSPKSKAAKTDKPGLPMKTEDLIKLIKKLPKGEAKKIKIRRKAD